MGLFSRDDNHIPADEEVKDPELLNKLLEATDHAEDSIPWWKR